MRHIFSVMGHPKPVREKKLRMRMVDEAAFSNEIRCVHPTYYNGVGLWI